MKIETKEFSALATVELYGILALRSQVFVVEQECAYQEVDGHDQKALHVLGTEDGDLVAYARLLPAGQLYRQPSIGRVAVKRGFRQKGFGREIFGEAFDLAREQNPGSTIKIQAQTYLEHFYQSFGFKTVSAPYPDVGVMHVDMLYS